MNKIWKILGALVICALFFAFTYHYWDAKLAVAYAEFSLRNDVALDGRPSTRILSQKVTPTSTVYRFGEFAFQTPWPVIPKRRGNGVDDLVLNFIPSGGVSSASPWVMIAATSSELTDGIAQNRIEFARFPMFSAVQTNYDFYGAILDLTRDDIGLFKPLSHSLPSTVLLYLKSSVLSSDGTLYRLENSHSLRGYELQSSATTTHYVLFTPSDDEFSVLIGNATQDQRDSVINSLRILP